MGETYISLNAPGVGNIPANCIIDGSKSGADSSSSPRGEARPWSLAKELEQSWKVVLYASAEHHLAENAFCPPLFPPSPSPLLAWVGRAICCACSWYVRQSNRLNVPVVAANLAPYKEPPCIWWSLQINSHPEGRLISTGLVTQNAKFVLEMVLLGEGSPEPFPATKFLIHIPKA